MVRYIFFIIVVFASHLVNGQNINDNCLMIHLPLDKDNLANKNPDVTIKNVNCTYSSELNTDCCCASFLGNSYIRLNNIGEFYNLDELSISLHIYPERFKSQDAYCLIDKNYSMPESGFSLFLVQFPNEPDSIFRIRFDYNGRVFSHKTYSFNNWYYLSIIFDRGYLSIYVNGKLDTKQYFENNEFLNDKIKSQRMLNNNFPIYVGADINNNPTVEGHKLSYFKGYIRDLRFYCRILDEEDILLLLNK